MAARALLALLLSALFASPALAKEYAASRFDARIEVLAGGHLRVTETVVFRFIDGTFKEVFRTIPTRRTDGVEFVSASMDGAVLPLGEGAGSVRVRQKNGLRVEWHFAPVANSTHTFELVYVARGVVQQAASAELLEWHALPREHAYRIDESEIRILAPAVPAGEPRLDTRRVEGGSQIAGDGQTIVARARNIRRNGSVTVSVPFARGSVLDGPPAWQARQMAHAERMPLWLAAAGGALLAGLVLLFALRQNYDAPPPDLGVQWRSMIPPDPLPPALGGVLAANGAQRLEHGMAALFSLAEQGAIAIREDPRRMLGQRSFTIERLRGSSGLAPHESTILDIVFGSDRGTGATVSLAKARGRLTRQWSTFKGAVTGELAAAGLLDPHRVASRKRYVAAGLVLLGAAAAAALGCILLLDSYGPWPLFVPLALALVAVTSFIIMASQTPLSNEGVRRGEHWRAFRKHLQDPQGIEPRWGAAGSGESRILPFAIALGLASAWSKYMKKRNAKTPSWFHAASGLESGQSFAIFVASGGAGTHGGGGAGGGGGGAAGGGASGAG
jgi:hypothetical protein